MGVYRRGVSRGVRFGPRKSKSGTETSSRPVRQKGSRRGKPLPPVSAARKAEIDRAFDATRARLRQKRDRGEWVCLRCGTTDRDSRYHDRVCARGSRGPTAVFVSGGAVGSGR